MHIKRVFWSLLAGITASFCICWDSSSQVGVDGTSWHLKILCCVRAPWGLAACWVLGAVGLVGLGPCWPEHVPLPPERELGRAGQKGAAPSPVYWYAQDRDLLSLLEILFLQRQPSPSLLHVFLLGNKPVVFKLGHCIQKEPLLQGLLALSWLNWFRKEELPLSISPHRTEPFASPHCKPLLSNHNRRNSLCSVLCAPVSAPPPGTSSDQFCTTRAQSWCMLQISSAG